MYLVFRILCTRQLSPDSWTDIILVCNEGADSAYISMAGSRCKRLRIDRCPSSPEHKLWLWTRSSMIRSKCGTHDGNSADVSLLQTCLPSRLLNPNRPYTWKICMQASCRPQFLEFLRQHLIGGSPYVAM
jgi:hypothetical protein